MSKAEQRLRELIAQQAEKSFAEHAVTLRLMSPPFMSWRCGKEKSSFYYFNVSFEPGRIFVTGDLGVMVFELSWLREAIHDPHYMAGKVAGMATKEFSEDAAKEWIEQSEFSEDEKDDLLFELEIGKVEFFRALQETDYASDMPTCETLTPQFLWIHAALKWFLTQLDAGKVPGMPGKAVAVV